MKYRVHLYPVIRQAYDVEADSMLEAIGKAEAQFVASLHDVSKAEYAEEIPYALVDVEGDEQHEQTQAFDFDVKDGEWVPV